MARLCHCRRGLGSGWPSNEEEMTRKLNQLLYDRRLSIKAGVDADKLMSVDAQIRMLRDALKGK